MHNLNKQTSKSNLFDTSKVIDPPQKQRPSNKNYLLQIQKLYNKQVSENTTPISSNKNNDFSPKYPSDKDDISFGKKQTSCKRITPSIEMFHNNQEPHWKEE